MMMMHSPILIDANKSVEYIGKPCAFCGLPSEGYFAVAKEDGSGDFALCVQHGAYPNPSIEEIYAHIRRRPFVPEIKIRTYSGLRGVPASCVTDRLKSGRFTPSQVLEAWECDACGYTEEGAVPYQHYEFSAFWYGTKYPGFWTVHSPTLCVHCYRETQINTLIIERIVWAAIEYGLPVAAEVMHYGKLKYGGLDNWNRYMKASDIRQEFETKPKLDITPQLRQKLAHARGLLGGPRTGGS